jgi:hypothetical protein
MKGEPMKPKRKHSKAKPKSRKNPKGSNVPKGTPMNGIKGIVITRPGFPVDEPIPEGLSLNGPEVVNQGLSLNGPEGLTPPFLKGTFKTRKTEAMRKRGLNFKGRPLGTSLNSLAIRFKVRKAQALKNGLKNDQKNAQKNGPKNQTKKSTKGRITERKKQYMNSLLEKVAEEKERNQTVQEVKKMVPQNSPTTILAKEKKREENRISKEYKQMAKTDKLFGETYNRQPTQMEGMSPTLAKELFKASHKAEMSDYQAQRRLLMENQPQTKPLTNTNVGDFRGKLATNV